MNAKLVGKCCLCAQCLPSSCLSSMLGVFITQNSLMALVSYSRSLLIYIFLITSGSEDLKEDVASWFWGGCS